MRLVMERIGMAERVEVAGLKVDQGLQRFIVDEALAGTGVSAEAFWKGFAAILHDLGRRNRELLKTRDALQGRIDDYHRQHAGRPFDGRAYERYLRDIGYLAPEPEDFSVRTANVDDEIARIAGPQLVVPVSNARYALNAANARWGNLYDALYGTDAIPEDGGAERGGGYNEIRDERVVARAKAFLDEAAPLARGTHVDARSYRVEGGRLVVVLNGDGETGLDWPEQFVGYAGDGADPSAVLLRNNNLHLEIRIDRSHPIGRDDPAGVADVILESAVSTIMDLEDSVAAVDAEDKVVVYRNWLGLLRGTLSATLEKGGKQIERRLNPDRTYTKPDGGTLTLHGRSLMLV